MKEQER